MNVFDVDLLIMLPPGDHADIGSVGAYMPEYPVVWTSLLKNVYHVSQLRFVLAHISMTEFGNGTGTILY